MTHHPHRTPLHHDTAAVTSVRLEHALGCLWPVMLSALAIALILFGYTVADEVWAVVNPEPLVSYHDVDPNKTGPGIPVNKQVYLPGEMVERRVRRSVREPAAFHNLIYLSTTREPSGMLIATVDQAVRRGEVDFWEPTARIPEDTPPGVYYLAGFQTVTSRYGSRIIEWYTVPFVVREP